jgi:RsiW-degrading membrane proteinase PrsW (M82 family)
MYTCTFVAALAWVWYLWRSTTQEGEVPLGLLVTVWFTSGTLSVGCCSLCNWAMVQLWAWMNPYCYITYPADNWPWDYTSPKCVMINVVQWILTAGIIEESFKFAALLRLRPSRTKLRAGIDACRCHIPLTARGWWMKLADSPLAVALCGVAAGGGLATTENFMYIFSQESIDKAFGANDLESAYGRIAASFAHMVWTGYAACGLAKFQFLPPGSPGRPRRKTSYLLPPIILHGLYNWCSTLQRCEEHEEVYKGKLYKSDGCYLPPTMRMVFKAGHTAVMLLSFYWWHREFSEVAGEVDEEELLVQPQDPEGYPQA